MKHVIFPAILAVTIPLWAGEQKETAAPAPAPQQQDSPLVAAAKRAGRLNKKPTFVITNETLAQMNGGRLSVSNTPQRPIVLPAPLPPLPPTSEMAAAEKAAKESATRSKMAAEEKKVHDARMSKAQQKASQYEDESYLDDDPAAAEHALEKMTQTPSETKKPPQD